MRGRSPPIPTRRAISAAVRPWSPLTTWILMPRLVAAGHGLRHPRARRVEQRHQADQDQVSLGVVALVGHDRVGERSARRREDTQSARGEPLDLRRDGIPVRGPQGPAPPPGLRPAVQRASSSSGAPLTSSHPPSSDASRGDISLRRGSNANAATRWRTAAGPTRVASSSSASSVGSP
jgi:hypothetical protein